MSLNTGDQGYNNGKKNGQKGTICGPNNVVVTTCSSSAPLPSTSVNSW